MCSRSAEPYGQKFVFVMIREICFLIVEPCNNFLRTIWKMFCDSKYDRVQISKSCKNHDHFVDTLHCHIHLFHMTRYYRTKFFNTDTCSSVWNNIQFNCYQMWKFDKWQQILKKVNGWFIIDLNFESSNIAKQRTVEQLFL